MGLVTLANMKTYLGEATTTYDTFLQTQIDMISEAIEAYCGRKFASANYVQTFHKEDYPDPCDSLQLYHFPVSAVASVKVDGEDLTTDDYRFHSTTGWVTRINELFFNGCVEEIEISYTAGFSTIPGPILSAIYGLVEEKYNRKKSGVALNFGNDVQSISIPGTISIQFDYSLNSNERKSTFGMLLGNYINLLDFYRSERSIGGLGKIAYVV